MQQHFLQSPTWEKFEQLEGSTTFRISKPEFEALVILKSTPLGNYLYCPYGPTINLTNNKSPINLLKIALSSLSDFAKSHQAFFIRIEPTYDFSTTDLKSLGLKKSHDLNPAHTWIIDLTSPESDILKNMRKSNVQYWRSHQNKGLKIRQTKDPNEITILSSLLRAVSEKDNFNPQDESHLKNQLKSGFATLYIAELDSQPLAASLVYDHNGTRFYAHAATSDENRKIAAGTVLLVQMILDAKNQGSQTFDFWGITTSEDPKHPWYGFTKYKKSFGGTQINYSGTWDLPLNPLRYKLYLSLRTFNRLKRKIFHH